MRPPFDITNDIVDLCSEISRFLGRYEGLRIPAPKLELRRSNRIKTIQGSLAIEGNSLSLDQVTAILEGKRVVGPAKDILEAKNAIRAYDRIYHYQIYILNSFLEAHKILMLELIPDAGKLRSIPVGILKGEAVSHIAPKPTLVPKLMTDLFSFLRKEQKIHPLIQSSVFHYECEFIHPFSDGNGRMGRLWQSAILLKFHPVFEFLPIESHIKEKQKKYYAALEGSDKEGKSTAFIQFMLEIILETMEEFLRELKPGPQTPETRLMAAKTEFGKKPFSRKDYLQFHKTLSTATASRDLLFGVKHQFLKKTGKLALTKYQFI